MRIKYAADPLSMISVGLTAHYRSALQHNLYLVHGAQTQASLRFKLANILPCVDTSRHAGSG